MDNNKPVTELPVKAPFDFAKWWDRVGILIVLLVLLILMSTFAPNFNRVDNLLNIARSISVNAILAAGMTFVILTSGIDLSVGSIVAVSGVISVVAAMAGIPAPLAILAGVGVGALCGLLNGETPAEALKLGWAHGALLTTFPGDISMASVDEVRAFASGGSARVQR